MSELSKVSHWNCDYVQKKHQWYPSRNQSFTGDSGVRVYCLNCDQRDTRYSPYSRHYLENALKVIGEALSL